MGKQILYKERRRVRSQQVSTALYLYLSALAERHDLIAVALADARGALMVGCHGRRARQVLPLDRLASLGAELWAPNDDPVEIDPRFMPAHRVSATRLELSGSVLYLTALGNAVPLEEVQIAIERICGWMMVASRNIACA